MPLGMPSKPFAVLGIATAFVLAAPRADASPAGGGPGGGSGGWQESHRSADDVRIAVGPDGRARIEHHVRYRVVAGRFKTFELSGIDPSAELEPEARVGVDAQAPAEPHHAGGAAAKNAGASAPPVATSARVERSPKTPGAVRVTFDDPKGLARGAYTFDVAYEIDLVATKALARDGAMWRLAWNAPAAPEGMDGARVTFDVPAASTEPSIASGEQALTTITTARHAAGRDELELVRAHVPRGESVTWAIRVDPRAFPQVSSPELRPAPPVSAPTPARAKTSGAVLGAVVLALAAGALAFVRARKQEAVARACALAGALAAPLVPVPPRFAPFAFGLATTLALTSFLWASPIAGSALLVLAMALATFRQPRVVVRPRGPGRWSEVPDARVFVPAPIVAGGGDALDLGTRNGRLVAAAVALAVAACAAVLRHHVPYAHVAIPLVATALVPLFATGTRAQLPLTPEELAARVLAPARDALAAVVDLAHVDLVPIARLREGTRRIDEVRLACSPRVRVKGLRSIELALATSPDGASAAIPQVLVRFDDGSSAAQKIAALAPGMEIVVGRVPEEKVLRVTPRVPTARDAARLVARLLRELEGRRAVDRDEPAPAFEGVERRGKRRRASCPPPRVRRAPGAEPPAAPAPA